MMPVFVISLPEAKDRRTRMTKIFNEMGLDFEFVDAVDGRQFDVLNHPNYDAPKRLRSFGRHMTGGEIGCFLSHKNIYLRMIEQSIPCALILEDDFILRDNFLSVLKKIKARPIPFDMIRFLGSPKLERLKLRNVYKIDDIHHLVRHTGMPGGAHATLMSIAGAHKLLKHMEKTALPIDALMGRNWKTGINWFTVRPGLAAQDLSFESSIGEERFNDTKDTKGLTKLFYPITRSWFKFRENIGKKYWHALHYFSDRSHKNFSTTKDLN